MSPDTRKIVDMIVRSELSFIVDEVAKRLLARVGAKVDRIDANTEHIRHSIDRIDANTEHIRHSIDRIGRELEELRQRLDLIERTLDIRTPRGDEQRVN